VLVELGLCHTESGKYKERYERQILFFEALAEYMAVLYLSAFSSNPGVWGDVRPKLQETLAKSSLSLEMATFGTWRVVLEVLGAEARRLLNHNCDMCYELFRTRNRVVVDRITSKKLVGILQDANAIRNKWTGHGGAVSETAAREVFEKLNQHISTVREIFGTIWESYEVLFPSVCRMKDGFFCYSARRIMGSRTPFQSIDVQLSEGMEDGQLHLWSPAESRTLKLLPLIKVMPSPKTEENACYFYNRREKKGIRFLSYYFESDSDVVQEFGDTAEALNRLSRVT
jgi:hypothetical protein